ncbi:PREDICTED: solute carrier family 13 member 1 isoform X4 [Dipodomys ordii]|uniref:Solute carrier family 13 member 1 isoform X4 n=1 Tax=Dipodomys ordii TaxID=10020 RepID=A0A1S3FFS0_DIPOR|nr:PREDICTED: solute carrier family 13 member 1 isoform X4 [Dipodomys ordii]
MKLLSYILVYRRFLLVLLSVLILLPLPLVICTKEAECAYVLFVVAILWITEALPLSITALLPGLLFPLFGIMPSTKVASAYFKDFHLLLIGVICLATSIEKWNLHKRIALRMVMMVGVNPVWLTLGFMSSTAFLSMWLSNTSTAAMVMPIVEAVAQQIISAEAEVEATQMTYFNESATHGLEVDETVIGQETNERKEKTKQVPGFSNDAEKSSSKVEMEKNAVTGTKYRSKKDHMMCKLMCLSIAYSSTIGGLTTITGTSTNLIFTEHFNTRYPECQCLNFGSWFIFSFPAAVILLVLSWIWLQWLFLGFNFKEMFKCGKTKTFKEKACADVIKQEYEKLGPMRYQEIVTLVLFFIMALLWFSRNPGFIAGWSELFAQYPGFVTDSTVALIIGLLFFLIPAKRLTKTTSTGEIEVASNPATITILLPILSPLAEAIHVNPLQILLPSTLCTSFAFLLPVANPPNAIVFSYGHLRVIDMVKAGLGVNILGVAVVMLGMFTWIAPMFDLYTYPSWAPVISNQTLP